MTETTPRNAAALDFLRTRRSRPYKSLSAPVPNREELKEILTLAARTPDHGQLVPFRFLVLSAPAMQRISESAKARAEDLGKSPKDTEKARFQYACSPLAVAVIARTVDSPKIPRVEQLHSAAGACLSLLNAALAAGWGANWITGWTVHDEAFRTLAFGAAPDETVVGLVHIGTASATPPERPRPDIEAITTWADT